MTAAVDSVTPTHTDDTVTSSHRPTPATVLVVTGGCCVVLGGLIAAVTGPLALERGSWLAAYLVLVAGVAQYAMGRAHRWQPAVTQPRDWTQVGAWNLGNGLVIAGTLAGRPLAVNAGSVLLFAALAIALHRTRLETVPDSGSPTPLIYWGYRAALLVLAVSIPVGILLSHLRHG